MKILNETINWGIIGAGNVCEKKSGPAFNKVPDSRLTAIMRRNPAKAKDFALRHHVPRYYTEVGQLIRDHEVNAIYVATPPVFHEEYAIAAMEAGNPVYIEKPVTLNARACENLIKVSSELKIPVTVAHYRRRLPLFHKVKQIVENGEIGKISLIRISLLQSKSNSLIANSDENWRVIPAVSGGGLFHDLAPHQLDIMYWIFGRPQAMKGHSTKQGKHFNAPDLTLFEAFFQGDVYFKGIWSFNINENLTEDCCEIFGDRGKICFSFFREPVLEIYRENETERFEYPYPEHVQQPMIADVVRFFRGKGPNPCSLEEALETMKMMDATRTSF
jgi:1,5-anhydro-D-fructose reductase (1,5-anhydro-D-mannitol-forming)